MPEAKTFTKEQQLARGERRYVRKVASAKEWQRIADAKRSLCRICKHEMPTMDLHHLVARVHGGDDTDNNVVMLCRGCHVKVTQRSPLHCRVLLAVLSDDEWGYLIRKGGPDYPLRAYGVAVSRDG